MLKAIVTKTLQLFEIQSSFDADLNRRDPFIAANISDPCTRFRPNYTINRASSFYIQLYSHCREIVCIYELREIVLCASSIHNEYRLDYNFTATRFRQQPV